jgi:hypothetical protein
MEQASEVSQRECRTLANRTGYISILDRRKNIALTAEIVIKVPSSKPTR